MPSVSEFRTICSWLDRLAPLARRRLEIARALGTWLESNEDAFQNLLSFGQPLPEPLQSRLPKEFEPEILGTLPAEFRWYFSQAGIRRAAKTTQRNRGLVERNVEILGAEFGLDAVDREILAVLYRLCTHDGLQDLFKTMRKRLGKPVEAVIAVVTGIHRSKVEERLRTGAPLLTLGLAKRDRSYNNEAEFEISDWLKQLMAQPLRGPEDVRGAVMGPSRHPELDWDDFEHLGEERELALSLLTASLRQGTCGVNILLYGPPGTGKTQFAYALGAKAGAAVYRIGEEDDEQGEPTRSERLGKLGLAQRVASSTASCVLLFDEAEDLSDWTPFGRRPTGSKVFRNRLLEENRVPVIWVLNELSAMDQASIRRMSLVLPMKMPPSDVRQRIAVRRIGTAGGEVAVRTISRLINEHGCSQAVIANAVNAVRMADRPIQEAEIIGRNIATALNGGVPPRPEEVAAGEFDLALLNTDPDVGTLADEIIGYAGLEGVSLCLYGPPGTGKSEFARHLAARLGLRISMQRASDLMSKWVGESEQNIARVFAEARANRTFLVFDEADSLLQDRRHAVRSWEIQQVNEMLTWMERHPLPFVCTTNLKETLDFASLRRFTFKVEFKPLVASQIDLACRRFFGWGASPALLTQGSFAPSDFSLVARQARIRGLLTDRAAIDRMLLDELAARNCNRSAIGFLSHAG